MSGWVAMHRSPDGQDLMESHPNAFLLLCQIAFRARWKDHPNGDLKRGECYVGDFKKAGIPTEMAYRHAKKVLEKSKIATFKGTSKGTVATLIDQGIFSFEWQIGTTSTTDEERTRNGRGTTNHKDTRIQGEEDAPSRPVPPKFSEVKSFAQSGGVPITVPCIEAFFDEMESLQWTYRGFPCVERSAWQARFRRFSTNWNQNELGRRFKDGQ